MNSPSWAILGFDLDAIRTLAPPSDAGDAGGGGAAYEADTIVPESDGLFVSATNVAGSALQLCLVGTDDSQQWCVRYTGQSFVPWSSFIDGFGSGGNAYARQPIYQLDLTVPTPPGGVSTPFEFCLGGFAEGSTSCGCDGGPCSCPAGDTACGGSCVDLTTDPNHCGTCTGSCASTSACSASSCHDSLAADQSDPFALAVDGTNAYFANYAGGTIVKVPLAGGAPTVLASNQAAPLAIVVDGANVYWANEGTSANAYADGAIMAVAFDAGTPVALASAQANPTRLIVNQGNLYWTNYGTSTMSGADGAVMTVPVTGGVAPTVLASEQPGAFGIAVAGTNLYWVTAGTAVNNDTDGTLMKLALTGGSPTRLASAQPSPADLAIEGSNAYFTNEVGDTVVSVPLTGGNPVTIASAQSAPYGIATDGTNVYWANRDAGSIMKQPLGGGGAPVTLAVGQNHTFEVVALGGFVYVTTQASADAGGVVRVTP